MKVDCQSRDIEVVSRMGKKSGKIRPIIVTLTTMGKKIELLKNKKMLQETSTFYIKEDFPPEVLEERKKLSTQLQQERQQGKKAYIKYNKLVILPEKINTQHERQKRILSQSPETGRVVGSQQRNTTKNPTKRNKMEQYLVKNKPMSTNINSPSHEPLVKK